MLSSYGINREYRDRLFKFIFGNPENKEWTLSLYNAMNGTDYKDPEAITFTTLENAVYMNMKNDVSFIVADTMSFYEQQTTFNPNMPMRFLIYAGMVYSKFVDTQSDYHIFSPRQQKAPTPKCVCFYNGDAEKEDRVILKLSDSFESSQAPDIEVTVTMLNVNYGHNTELLNACKPMQDYALFLYYVKENRKVMDLNEAISKALEMLPEDSVIKPFLTANKAEVTRMCIFEYDEEKAFAAQRAEGRAEGALDILINLVKDGVLTVSDAAQRVGMNIREFRQKTGLDQN